MRRCPERGWPSTGPCAAGVSIGGGAADRIVVRATAEHAEELAVLTMGSQDGTANVRRRAGVSCWRPAGVTEWAPTLRLLVTVPPATAVAVGDGGGADYEIGGVDGPLSLSLSGAATAHVDAASSLSAALSGANKIAVGRASGPVRLDLSGADTVDMGALQADRLQIEASGHGVVDIKSGEIGSLLVDETGASVVTIGATVSNASVSASGAGTVRIARVTGPFNKDVEGAARVSVLSR